MHVELFFDPGCPWTWLTSRWLVEASEVRGFVPTWRTFDIDEADPDRDVPPEDRPLWDGARAARRVIETLRAAERNDDVGRLYSAYGSRTHTQRDHRGVAVVLDALADVGLEDLASAVDDVRLDEVVARSTAEALDLVGGGVGSPILAVTTDRRRGMFGPIQAPPLRGERAGHLWDGVSTLIAAPEVAELKRARGIELPLPQEVEGH